MMMKKFITGFISAAAALNLCSACLTANSEIDLIDPPDLEIDEYMYGDLTYILKDDHAEIISCELKASGEIIIPKELDGLPVTVIGANCFFYCANVTSVVIPDSVTEIKAAAFSGCTGLTEIDIPDKVTNIETGAFLGCRNLESIAIPESVEYIGDGAFYNCLSLADITFPDGAVEISQNVFNKTSWYESQPDGMIYIGNIAYCYKGAMPENSEIVFKDGTTAIGGGAFFYNCNITSAVLPESLKIIGMNAFYKCHELKTIEIADGVENISEFAFYGCIGLESIYLPYSVNKIGNGAFANCGNMKSVIIPNPKCEIFDSANTIFSETGEDNSCLFYGTIYAPEGSAAQTYAEKYGYNFEAITIPYRPHNISDISGDANCDGKVRLNDAVLIMQSIGNPEVYGLGGTDKNSITAQGIINADCCGNNDGLTNNDALSIQRYLIHLVDALPIE